MTPRTAPTRASLATLEHQGFLVAAIYTADYAPRAARLEASLRALGLAYVLYEVPHVHRSMSRRGRDDAAYTKAAFIHALLDRYESAILYVDADMVFRAHPEVIANAASTGVDFAIYNWLADEHTDAFKALPENAAEPLPPIHAARFLGFSHSVDHFATDQLLCSGATQFYGNSAGARRLLDAWAGVIEQQPGVADDHCLDLCFNNGLAAPLSVRWLQKDYVRYNWWIYVKPLIDHPDAPAAGTDFARIAESAERPRMHRARLRLRPVESLIPRDCVIDVPRRMLCRVLPPAHTDGPRRLVPVAPLKQELFLER